MPRLKPHTQKVVKAHERLAVLEAQKLADSAELARLELDLKEAVGERRGVAAIADAERLVSAARQQLEATESELAALLEQIPILERESDREEGTADLIRAARDACSAAADIQGFLGRPEIPFGTLLENLQSAYLRLETARMAYDFAGREMLPGWEQGPYGPTVQHWEGRSEKRKQLEQELKDRGADLGPVTSELEADPNRADDFVYQAAWRLFLFVQQTRRTELARAEQERENERRRAEAAEASRREEERELRALSARVTFPLAFDGRVQGALGGLIIGSESFSQRVNNRGDLAEFGRVVVAQPDILRAQALLFEALGQENTVQNVLFQNDERADPERVPVVRDAPPPAY